MTDIQHTSITAKQASEYLAEMEDDFIVFIRERLGIVIKKNNIDLGRTIFYACKRFNCNPREYLLILAKSKNDSPELEHLIAGVTIGETYFFRDKDQMNSLYETILPEIIKSKRAEGNYTLRIWSAGCSSGEEIYTLAMMLSELLTDISKWQLHLMGTDINVYSLQKALAGKYSEWSMRSISEKFKQRYFVAKKNEYFLSDKIKQLAMFEYLNLNDDSFPSVINNTFAQDMILCRNVMIYFDSNHISQLMKKFCNCLLPNGLLMVGSSDPINLTGTTLVRHDGSHGLFQRHTIVHEKHVSKEKPVVIEVKKEVTKLKTLHRPHIGRKKEVTEKLRLVPDKSKIQHELNQLAQDSKWEDIIFVITKIENAGIASSQLLTLKASALANLGRIEDAIKYCHKSLAMDQMDKYTYFILALAYSEQDNIIDAEAAFRRAIFLDHDFAICHFQLGLFLLRHKHPDDGIKALANALRLSQKHEPKEVVPYANDLCYGRLTEILEREIELYTGT